MTAKNERKVGYEIWLTNEIVIIATHITEWATFAYNILYCEDFLNSLTYAHRCCYGYWCKEVQKQTVK